MERIRLAGKIVLGKLPILDRWFRRLLWSRIHFPEYEMLVLSRMDSVQLILRLMSVPRAEDITDTRGKSKTVHAFDSAMLFPRTRKGLLLSNIVPVKAAISDIRGTANLNTPGNDSDARHTASLELTALSSTQDKNNETLVQTISLDEFFGSHEFKNRSIDFIKVDIEGHEYIALLGAKRILSEDFPVVLCEIEERHNYL